MRPGGIAPELISTNGPLRRALSRWRMRATRLLPVPLSAQQEHGRVGGRRTLHLARQTAHGRALALDPREIGPQARVGLEQLDALAQAAGLGGELAHQARVLDEERRLHRQRGEQPLVAGGETAATAAPAEGDDAKHLGVHH